jgi:hypothetical protein
MGAPPVTINRTQALVLGFFLAAWVGLLALLALGPDVFARALRLPPGGGGRAAALVFLVALTAFLALLGLGVVRRWRWLFWLLLVAFLAGVLRVPVSLLELAGVLPAAAPSWYLLVQAGLGLVQLALGLTLLAGYRRAGVWGAG